MKKFLLPLIILLLTASIANAQTIRATQFVFGQSAITASRRILTGAGSPEGVVTGPIGTVYLRTNGSTATTLYVKESGTGNTGWAAVGGSTGASTANTYITQTAAADLSAEQALSGLSSGIMRVATTTGVVTSLTDSAGVFGNISDETGGTGVLVGSVSPSITTPTIVTSETGPLWIANTTNGVFRQNTSDGADTGSFGMNGGGAAFDATRGAGLRFAGNEFSGAGGYVSVLIGNATNAEFEIRKADGTQGMYMVGSSGATFFPYLSAGAAGDTDACLNATTNELTDAGASTCIVSSLRFKDVIAPLDTGLADVLRLHPFSYSLKNDPLKVPQIGLSAEEMNEVEPRLVFYEHGGPDTGKPRGIMYEQSVALLVKAIQDLNAKVEALEQSRLRKLLPW